MNSIKFYSLIICLNVANTISWGATINADSSTLNSIETRSVQAKPELDAFMKKFTKTLGENKNLIYKNGQVTLFTKYEKIETINVALISAILVLFPLFTLYLNRNSLIKLSHIPQILILIASFIIGAYCTKQLIHRLKAHATGSSTIYLIIDSRGITINDSFENEYIPWTSISSVNELIDPTSFVHEVELLDQNESILGTVAEGDLGLSITAQQFLVIFEKFWKCHSGNSAEIEKNMIPVEQEKDFVTQLRYRAHLYLQSLFS